MCLPSPKVITPPPPPTPRWLQDTSGEMIKSKYPLSAQNRKKNQTLLNSRKQTPTIASATNNNENGGGGGGGGGSDGPSKPPTIGNTNPYGNKTMQEVADFYSTGKTPSFAKDDYQIEI